MRKLFVATLAVFFFASFVACNKDGDLSEGNFQPKYKISELSVGSTPAQIWDWGSSKLNYIEDKEAGAIYSFAYSGDLLSYVTISYSNGDPTESIIYSYQGSLLSRIEVVRGSTTQYSMDVLHDADDHISSMNILVSDGYLVDLAQQMILMGKCDRAISHLLSQSAIRAMAESVTPFLNVSKSAPKYSISNKHFVIEYQWDGNNLQRETLSGNVTATASISDVAEAFDFGSYTSIITSLLGDEDWPLSATVNSTTTYTYDKNHNPWRYCWIEGLTASNLSKNNPITETTTGSADATITLVLPESLPFVGGMSYPFERTVPLDSKVVRDFSYNGKGFPDALTVDGKTYDITYEK